MFGYEAFYSLKLSLVKFFYSSGDLLPTDQVDGLDHVYRLLDLYRNEVDTFLLNLSSKKKSLYLIELESQAYRFESPFGELFLDLFALPEAQEVLNRIPLDENGNRSAQLSLAAIRQELFSDSISIERDWTGGTIYYPTPEASASFFATLTPWQKVAMRYKHVNNIILTITEHIVTKKGIWGMQQQLPNGSTMPQPKREIDLLEWKGDAKKLAELLYLAEKAGMLNLKDLREKGVLEAAMDKFCEGILFTKSKIVTPGSAVYNCLVAIKAEKLGSGNLDYPSKNDPWGRAFIFTDKSLKNK